MGDELTATLKQRVEKLQNIIDRQEFIEDRYEELLRCARRVLRYDGVDQEMCNAAMGAMSALIKRQRIEIDEMEEQG